jgi:DNA repair protein RecO (recombination protein O)
LNDYNNFESGLINLKYFPLLHKTKAIVLRTVKFGETSLVATLYTELFGLQNYLIKGVRQTSKKGGGKASLFQPSAILNLVVYHNELKQLQIIKEMNWAILYQHVLSDVVKNSVALFMVELIAKSIREPENNPDLFEWLEQQMIFLDTANPTTTSNFPIHFAWAYSGRLGFAVEGNFTDDTPVLDIQEGMYMSTSPQHANYIAGELAEKTSQFIHYQSVLDTVSIPLNRFQRNEMLTAAILFFQYHIQDFGTMKTIDVLKAIF